MPFFILYGPFVTCSTVITIPSIVSWKLNSVKHQYESVSRDSLLLDDVKMILTELPDGATVSIDFQKNYTIHGYFARYGNISLDADVRHSHTYLISFEDGWSYQSDRDTKGRYLEEETAFQQRRRKYKEDYRKVALNTTKLHLYTCKK